MIRYPNHLYAAIIILIPALFLFFISGCVDETGDPPIAPPPEMGPLSGSLNGTLERGIYNIVDTIRVEADETLNLIHGTVFDFDEPYPFYVYGTLLAEGLWEDFIVFTADTTLNPERWGTLYFLDSTSSSSRLSYCLIENGRGVHCSKSSPSLTYCTFSHHSASGLYCLSSSPVLFHCTIKNNNSRRYGGGIQLIGDLSLPSFTNCTISDNQSVNGGGIFSSSSIPTFITCTIAGNSATLQGGGVACEYSSPVFENCTINNNSADRGGGIYCYMSASPTLTNCVLYNNSASYGGGVFCLLNSSPLFLHCTLSGNSGENDGAVFCFDSAPVFNSSIIAFSGGFSVDFQTSETTQLTYCNIFGEEALFGGGIPAGLGELVTTNANMDSCDVYHNIFLDPRFVNTEGYFRLANVSPCIGAADTASTISTDYYGNPRPNPPESLPDIGAYEN
ncbi:right-handed parallel beta-helix repeat-containing protein [bacterium]|nr:right-handed parallel beta-helix repeat-containing protein [bacterium]